MHITPAIIPITIAIPNVYSVSLGCFFAILWRITIDTNDNKPDAIAAGFPFIPFAISFAKKKPTAPQTAPTEITPNNFASPPVILLIMIIHI